MNGIEKITERIAVDNAAEVRALTNRAQQQADSIFEGYKAAADADYEETIARGKVEADERVERLSGVAQLEVRKLNLKAKQEMLDKAFDLAAEKLLKLPEDQYVALLAKLAAGASNSGKEVLILSETDCPVIGDKVVAAANELLAQQGKTAAMTLAAETRSFRGGLYVQDEKVETNCTFETLIRLERESMALEVAGILFN